MYLELADHYSDMPMTSLAQNTQKESPFLFVPAGMIPGLDQDTFVNEDQFDDLDDFEWEQMMALLEPYQEQQQGVGLWPFSTKKTRARKKERRKTRQEDKLKRIGARGKAGGGIGGLFKGIVDIFKKPEPTYGPEMDIVGPGGFPPPAPAAAEKTWIQKNWGYVAGGAVVVVGGILLARAQRKK